MTNVYKDYVPPVSGGLYHKFEDGVTYMLRIASEPVVFETEFTDKKTNETTVSTKYGWIVFDLATKTAKIMQLSVTAYKLIAAFGADAEYGDPKMYNLKITRTGTGFDTQYSIIASPNKTELASLAENAVDAVAAIDLIGAISSGTGVNHVFWLSDAIGNKDSKKSMTMAQVNAADYPTEEGVKADQVEDKKPIDISEIPF